MNMETVDLVTAVINGDKDAAKAAFDSMIADKVSDALEIKKVELATNLISPEEVADESTETQTEVDGAADASAEASSTEAEHE
jgi:hypothetical protein